MTPQQLLTAAAHHVSELYTHPEAPALLYHNLTHTQNVVRAAGRIADHYRLDEEAYAVVHIAAWFHDIGYLSGPARGHEAKSAAVAQAFLLTQGAAESFIARVMDCIHATHMPQRPTSLEEQIVCDADVFHFGTDDFRERNRQMHREVEIREGREIPGAEWRADTIRLLQEHRFQTEYCQVLLKKGKDENLARLLEKSSKKQKEQPVAEITAIAALPKPAADPQKEMKEEKGKEEKKEEKLARGVETMYRMTSSNHLKLSSMADNKAHILITVNSIIISVIVSLVVRKLDSEPHLIIPIIILVTSSLVTIIFSILVTRPNVTRGISTKEDITQRKSNLLFFGNFYNMDRQDYEWGMKEMRKDVEFAYDSMSRDIFFLGKVLARKYRLLHKAYNFFMFGLVISVVALLIAQIIYNR